MRIATAILLSATCFFAGIDCHAQDSCSPTSPERVHQVLHSMPDWDHVAFEDIEIILKCGLREDAEEFFSRIQNKAVQMVGATVVDASQDAVRVSWKDSFKPNLAAFKFNFDRPPNVIPHPGDKITISGTYSSYSREPFQINLTNASFVPFHPRQSKKSMEGEPGAQGLGPSVEASH